MFFLSERRQPRVTALQSLQLRVPRRARLSVLAGAGFHSQALAPDPLHRDPDGGLHLRLLVCRPDVHATLGEDASGRLRSPRAVHLSQVEFAKRFYALNSCFG